MSILLAIDTATEACSVAISYDGEITEKFGIMPRLHSQKVLPMIEQLLAETGVDKTTIDAIAFGRGPGAFTGVRIATAITQGLAFALDKPVIPVSSLAALAQQAIREHNAAYILSAIDARMDEVYWAPFIKDSKTELAVLAGKESITVPEKAFLEKTLSTEDQSSVMHGTEKPIGIGTGWTFHERFSVKARACYIDAYPHAQDIVRLAQSLYANGHTILPELAAPVYLRNDVAQKKTAT